MKQIITKIITLGGIVSIMTVSVSAATPSPTGGPSPKPTANIKIEDLKERLATKVAEMRKMTPKAVFGTVTQVSISTITIDTPGKAVKIELTDDIKVFQILKGKRTQLVLDNVEKNDVVTVFGDYDGTLDILRAKKIFIEAPTRPVRVHGKIAAIDKKNNVITLKGIDGETYTIDIESDTKTFQWTKGKGVEKSGFSKLEEGAFMSLLGTAEPKKINTYSALRLLFLSQQTVTPTPPPTITKEATPSPTVKRTPTTAL